MAADGDPRNEALDARRRVRLAVTPAAYATESLLGYVLRVSEMNGYESPKYVWTSAGIHRGVELGAGFPADRLARVLGRAPSELQRLAYREGEITAAAGASDKRPFKILNHRLHRGGVKESAPFRLKHPAFCPQCVAEAGHIDALWDLEIATACPVHRCRILRACPACKVQLSWIRPGLLTCSCGRTLAGAHTQEATSALAELVGLVRAQLHCALQEELPNTSGLPFDELRNMSLCSLLPMLMTLGSEVLRLPELVGEGKTELSVLTMADGAAFALADWPHGFHRVLRAFGHQRLSAGVKSGRFRKQFEPLYKALFMSGRDTGPFEFIRTEFLRFGQQWEHAVLDKRHFRSSSAGDERRFITIGDFATRHRIWKPTLARLIEEGAIVTRNIPSASGIARMVDLEKTVLPQDLGESVTVRSAALELDLPVKVLETLRVSGVYRVRPRRGRGSTYYRDDVAAFKQRLVAVTAGVTEPDGEGSVALRDVMRLKLRSCGRHPRRTIANHRY
jgi:TniQ